MYLEIKVESPNQPEVERLLQVLDGYLSTLYPAVSNHFLDVEDLTGKDVRFVVAREAGQIVGCGALKLHPEGFGEIKRVFVVPEERGRGIGSRLLDYLETLAIDQGLSLVCLDTGVEQPDALALYS